MNNPDDLCAFCGHKRKDHFAKDTYGGTSSRPTVIDIPPANQTACWGNCLCSCLRFVEHCDRCDDTGKVETRKHPEMYPDDFCVCMAGDKRRDVDNFFEGL